MIDNVETGRIQRECLRKQTAYVGKNSEMFERCSVRENLVFDD